MGKQNAQQTTINIAIITTCGKYFRERLLEAISEIYFRTTKIEFQAIINDFIFAAWTV